MGGVSEPSIEATTADAVSRNRDDSSWAGAAVRDPQASVEVDCFQFVREKRLTPTVGGNKPGVVKRPGRGSGLKGAVRAHCLPFHLPGISLVSDADDIISYCRGRHVLVTGCYLIRSRVWSTQSAKIYVDKKCRERILEDSFWPEHLSCRVWEADPPKSKRNFANSLQWLSFAT